eukprot:TRINITY_DN57328_c0_g1_i1.p1 TRINITY_DN57328_c0_g1~~TRINITY_DN57328_c0_g1_i1.p1  ORF type:complete len:367 (+),score=143.27 TRINITY_DN57328_c0_g1_i1:80-1102(+)
MPTSPEDLLTAGQPAERPRPLPPAPRKRHLTLAGLLQSEIHQKVLEAVQHLSRCRAEEYAVTTLELLPFEWRKWMRQQAEGHDRGKELLAQEDCVVIDTDTQQMWIGLEFVDFVRALTDFKLFHYPAGSDDPDSYANAAQRRYKDFLRRTGGSYCWMEIKVGEAEPRRIVFQLFTDKCPMTSENFRRLCLGDLPPTQVPGTQKKVKLHYQGCTIFRVVKDGWVQGGDISNPGTMKAGSGGLSIFQDYGGQGQPTFPDECFDIAHDDEGILGMANVGPHTNGSQFYITVARQQWMNGKYVAFGRVVDGIRVVRQIHAVPTKPNQAPSVPIVIVRCGELDLS